MCQGMNGKEENILLLSKHEERKEVGAHTLLIGRTWTKEPGRVEGGKDNVWKKDRKESNARKG